MGDNSKVDFSPAVAKTAIDGCSTLIGHLLAVRSFLGARNVEDFAGPEAIFKSGHLWTEGFTKLDTELDAALGTHIAVVTALSEKFKNAIKEFKNAEDESIAVFLNQKMPDTMPASPTSVSQGPDYSKIGSKTPSPKPVEKYVSNRSSKSRTHAYAYNETDIKTQGAVWPENPYVKGWNDLRALGESIKGAPGRLAADWGWMKDELNKAVTDFKAKTNEANFRNSWTSGSGPLALAAMESARTAISDLISKMGDVEDRLYKAEGWLKSTAERMPKGDAPEVKFHAATKNQNGRGSAAGYTVTDGGKTYQAATANDCMESALVKYRQDCEAYYVAGLMEYNSSRVTLPQPEAPKVDAPPSIPQPNGNPKTDQPAGSPQTNPSGSPTGGTPSAPNLPTDTPQTPQTPETPQQPTTPQTPTTTTPDTTLTTLASALTTLAQSGAQMVESLASQGSSLIQSLAQTTQKTTDTTAKQLEQQLASLLTTPSTPVEPTSPGGSPGGTPTGGAPGSTPKSDNPQTRLFPRAAAVADEKTETQSVSRAGLATGTTTGTGTSSGSGMAGSPMGAGAGQGGSKEHKRPEFLRSGQNLDDVFEGVPEAVRPVAEK
ncbi:hypothetical protein ACFYTS_23740 [Nocardia sp. NPDC004151]|uniref:hypothetical protein n=1 Tax=Nocardia sp. NPDC004151 TaxID=3364304 RepID=UPI0036A44A18